MSVSYNKEATRGIQHNSMAPNVTFDDQDIIPLLRRELYILLNIKAGPRRHFLGLQSSLTAQYAEDSAHAQHRIQSPSFAQ
jgi:hypothetical protein